MSIVKDRLRETLEAATPGPWLLSYSGNFVVTEDALVIAETGTYQMPKENARLIALTPELAALALDMGEELRAWLEMSRHAGNAESPTTAALLARLDQLGKEQTLMETSPDPECTCDPHPLDDPCDACRPVPARRPEDALDRLVRAALNSVPAVDPAVIDEWRSTVREALERQRRHPDAWSQEAFDQQKARAESAETEADKYRKATDQQARRAEAAEAEVRRLTEGLRDLIKGAPEVLDQNAVWVDDLLDLLSASPSDGGGAK